VDGFGVRGVFTEGDFSRLRPGGDFIAPDSEERTQDFEFSDSGAGLHSTQAGGTRAAQEVEEASLDLVIGMVGERDAAATAALRTAIEKRVAEFPGGEFEGFFVGGGVILGSRPGEFQRETEFGGGARHEFDILCGCLSAERVVEVADGEFFEPAFQQTVEEHHRVPAAGDADEQWRSF
jgi:hypothetical protein